MIDEKNNHSFGKGGVGNENSGAEPLNKGQQEQGRKGSTPAIQNYTLRIPQSLYRELWNMARENHTTILELMKRAIALLLAMDKEKSRGATFVIRTADSEKEVILI